MQGERGPRPGKHRSRVDEEEGAHPLYWTIKWDLPSVAQEVLTHDQFLLPESSHIVQPHPGDPSRSLEVTSGAQQT